MGVKFGTEEGTEDKGVGPPKLKFLLRFDRNLEYNRPSGAYPLHDFHKICRVCTSFQDALGVALRASGNLPVSYVHTGNLPPINYR